MNYQTPPKTQQFFYQKRISEKEKLDTPSEVSEKVLKNYSKLIDEERLKNDVDKIYEG